MRIGLSLLSYTRATYLKILVSSLSLNILYFIRKFQKGLESGNPLLWNSESLVPFKEVPPTSDMPSGLAEFCFPRLPDYSLARLANFSWINARLFAALATGSQASEVRQSKGTPCVHSSSIEIRRHKVWQARILESQQVLGATRILSLLIYCQPAALAITHVISCSASSPIQAVNHCEFTILARVSRGTRIAAVRSQ